MKRFQFQLATALDWRKRRMEAEQARLDEVLARQAGLRRMMEDAARDRARSGEELLRARTIEAEDLAALDAYRRALDAQKRRLERELAAVEEAIGRQRQLVMTAMRDYRLMEKLKDRRLEEWRKQFEREVENEATELYLAKRGRTG